MINLCALSVIALSFLGVTRVSALDDIGINFGLKGGKVAAAWWASWHSDLLPLEQVSWKKYTRITYAFA